MRYKIDIKAFTLLEIMVALTILALVLTGTMVAVNESLNRFDYISKKTFSILMADSILTRYKIKSLSFPKEVSKINENFHILNNENGSWVFSRQANFLNVEVLDEHKRSLFELKAHE